MSDHSAICRAIQIEPERWQAYASAAQHYLDEGYEPRAVERDALASAIAAVRTNSGLVCETPDARAQATLVMGYVTEVASIHSGLEPVDARETVYVNGMRLDQLAPLSRGSSLESSALRMADDVNWVTRPYYCDRQFNDGVTSDHLFLDTVLDDIATVKARGETPVVVFDLDDTLFFPSDRYVRILHEYIDQFTSENPGELSEADIATMRAIPKREFVYRIDLDLEMIWGIDNEKFLKGWFPFFRDRFFTNDFVEMDGPYPGGPEYVRAIEEAGATVVYFTARNDGSEKYPGLAEGMRQGTTASLKREGYPVPNGESVHLIMKPNFESDDFEYKAKSIGVIESMGTVVATFDNAPKANVVFAQRFPDALLFNVGNCQMPYYGYKVKEGDGSRRPITLSDIPERPEGILLINHFERVK